jgi:hypothetical protein
MYELGLKTKQHPATILGSILHKALEKHIGEKTDLFTAYDNAFKEFELNDQTYYEDGKNILKNLLTRGITDEKVKTLTTEKEFDITLENGVRIYGFIDRIDERDSQILEITDYKSTKHPFTQNEIDDSLQGGIYNLAAKKLYPSYPIVIITFDFLRYNRMSTMRTQAKLNALEEYLKMMKEKIEGDKYPKGNVTYNCKWCDFNGDCPDFKKKIDMVLTIDEGIYNKTDEELIQELDSAELRANYWKEYTEKLEEYFKNRLMGNEQLSIKGTNGASVYIKSRQQKMAYDENIIREICAEKNIPLENIMTFSKKKIDELLSDDKSQERLKKTAKIYYSEPSIKTRTENKDK